ncbi:3-phosphoshikimate 1-carboxyvinyltransferase [Candidatus Roizmanbacteria bacterium]|nr:3-phosphoshikimate 1-carboxyvinyltransferase [Candidatus Roizmanbacteria bacterium]
MKTISLEPIKKPITRSISLPGSKSLTNRALIMAALSNGKSIISNASVSVDSLILIDALKRLGIQIQKKKDRFEIIGNGGNFSKQNRYFNIGHAGTAMRFLTAVCSLVPGEIILDGSERMRKRPIGELVNALRKLGGRIEFLKKNGFAPIKILGGKLIGGTISVKGSISSQFITALLLIGPLLQNGLIIEVIGDQVSKSYIDMTIGGLKKFGVNVKNQNYQKYCIDKNQKYTPFHYEVETDASGASYFLAIAAVTGKKVKIKNMNTQSVQGDMQFPDLLERMGCSVERNNKENSITIQGPKKLKGINIDMNSMPDTIQTLAVVAAFAKGTTKITGTKTLRIKETDRLHALQTELLKMNIKTQINDNSILIKGGNPIGATIDTYDDHRMAMSFAVAGSKLLGMKIENPSVVSKSFPEFWKRIRSLGVEIKTI